MLGGKVLEQVLDVRLVVLGQLVACLQQPLQHAAMQVVLKPPARASEQERTSA